MNDIKRTKTLINKEYLREYSLFPKNYDLTEVENFIPIAEQIHIVPILGIPLYEELIEQVSTNTLTEANSTLLIEIYKVEGIAVFYESMPFVWSHVSQVGITKGKSDNSDSIDNKDITYLSTDIKSKLNYLKEYLIGWLNDYSDNFPLYSRPDTECAPITKKYVDIFPIAKDIIDII